MLLGLAGTFIFVIAFGFSTTFEAALFCRFSWGFLNGNVGVGKTYLSEILDNTNQARGMSVLGIQGGISLTRNPKPNPNRNLQS